MRFEGKPRLSVGNALHSLIVGRRQNWLDLRNENKFRFLENKIVVVEFMVVLVIVANKLEAIES